MPAQTVTHDRRRNMRRSDDRRFRTILAADVDGVVVVDRDGVTCYANPAAEVMLGRSAEHLVGQVFGFPLVAGETTELNLVRGADANAVVEMRVVETEWDGEPALLASLRDVTDRLRAESERAARLRAEAERAAAAATVRARDAFLELAAHELKTPLTRIALFAQNALRRMARRKRPPAPDPARDALLLVDRETAHLARLVNQMLDLARIENGTFGLDRRPVDLRELVAGVAARIRAMSDEDPLSVRLPDGPVVVLADARALDPVVTSLVAGAVRQSARAGVEVELAAETGPDGPVGRLIIRDKIGPLAPEARAVLTDPTRSVVETAAATSVGVAVHVARRVVELHGGSLTVDFPEERGTRLRITLPTASA